MGVWHSERFAHRLRWILESWYDPVSVVFLAQRNGTVPAPPGWRAAAAGATAGTAAAPPAPPPAVVEVLGTGAPADDYLGTLQKGLLGLQLMFERHPDRQWYLIVGDDVYVDLDALAHALSALDPDAEHCVSEGEILATQWYDGFRLNGGAGLATSHALTRRLAAGALRAWAAESFATRTQLTAAKKQLGPRYYFGMHDLYFGAKLFELGKNLTHAEGLFSQALGFYGAQALGVRLEQYEDRPYKGLWDGSAPPLTRAVVFHYTTGPFLRWAHEVCALARDTARCAPRVVGGGGGGGGGGRMGVPSLGLGGMAQRAAASLGERVRSISPRGARSSSPRSGRSARKVQPHVIVQRNVI